LARPSEVWEITAILDNPPVYIAGDGACMPIISTALDLALKLYSF
jgi:hypothetical protein